MRSFHQFLPVLFRPGIKLTLDTLAFAEGFRELLEHALARLGFNGVASAHDFTHGGADGVRG